MDGARILFFLCMVLSNMSPVKVLHVEEFQFQCYGERTLCMYPNEYCSSDSRKCVECSTEICSDIVNIPKACWQKCVGGVEQHQSTWFIPFIIVSVIASVLLCTVVYYFVRKWYKTRRENGPTGLCFVSSGSMETGTSTRSSPELKRLVQPTSNIDDGNREEHYCERKLKSVNPSQNPNSEYKPTPSNKGLSPVQSFTS